MCFVFFISVVYIFYMNYISEVYICQEKKGEIQTEKKRGGDYGHPAGFHRLYVKNGRYFAEFIYSRYIDTCLAVKNHLLLQQKENHKDIL